MAGREGTEDPGRAEGGAASAGCPNPSLRTTWSSRCRSRLRSSRDSTRTPTPCVASASRSEPGRTAGRRSLRWSMGAPGSGRHTCSNQESAVSDARQSESGFPIEPVYGPDALSSWDAAEQLGVPGQFPFTRGVYPSMYTGRPWTMRQYAGFGTAKESNERYHQLLAAGTTGLSVAFDLPTQMGYDSDHPVASGEVGKVGVAIDSIDDMRVLFDRIPLDQVTTSMTINAPAAVLLLLYQLVAEEQGVDAADARRHDPERRAQGVHRPRHLHLPAGGVPAAHHRHLPVLPGRDPALEHDLDLRLPHGRGRCHARAGDRLHARQRCRVRARCDREPDSTSTTSHRGSRSSSSRARRSSKRWRSSAPLAGCGHASCVTSSVRRTRSR